MFIAAFQRVLQSFSKKYQTIFLFTQNLIFVTLELI